MTGGPDGRQRRSMVAALAVVAWCAGPASAAATVGVATDDARAAARALLPVGDPCRAAGIGVVWVPGLRDESGEPLAGAAVPGVCAVALEPAWWRVEESCDRRRLVYHEVGHVAGLPDAPGSASIMDPDPGRRADVPVRGCPGPSLADRVLDAVLWRAPVGSAVTCGRTGRVVYCRAVSPSGRRVRWYRGAAARSGGVRVVEARRPRHRRRDGTGPTRPWGGARPVGPGRDGAAPTRTIRLAAGRSP